MSHEFESLVDQARIRHLDHCRRHRCFVREHLQTVYFEHPESHPDGPCHGIYVIVDGSCDTHLVRYYSHRPLLVERQTGVTKITLTCICSQPGLHADLCCHLCARFNQLR